MKTMFRLALCLLFVLSNTSESFAVNVVGKVFRDSNQNNLFDASDAPIPGVLVVVTNQSGTFSNGNWTTTPDAIFVVGLPNVGDTYAAFIYPPTLSGDSTVVIPATGVARFSVSSPFNEVNTNFLVGTGCPASGLTNSWTKAISGQWQEPVWSLGGLPGSCETIEITNSGFKAVGIDNSTATSFSETLTVRHLDIFAPTGSFNTLLLNFAGTGAPLHVLNGVTVATNGRILNLSSGLLVDSGGLTITNGEVAQEGGFAKVGDLVNVLGRYNLTNGSLQAPLETVGNGAVDSRFVQNGGTNATGDLVLRGGPPVVRYDLLAGRLTAGSEEVFNGVRGTTTLFQSGGQNIVTNQLRLEGAAIDRDPFGPGIAQYTLTGGTLSAASMQLGAYSSFAQSNGTATISGPITFTATSPFFRTTSFLAGGTLRAANLLFSGAGENLTQTGGALIVTNLFSFGGFAFSPPLGFALYDFSGGTLMASNIEIEANMSIGSPGGQTRRITNPGFFRLSGGVTLTTATINERLGRFILGAFSTVDMGGGSSKLAFANSSTEAWAAGGILSIVNWNGSTNGGGSDQVFFGTNSTGLTASQLSQIRFENPVGLAPGTYFGRILSTGEVVPTPQPTLVFSRTSNALVFSWQGGSFILQTATNVIGPYVDITNATSPFTFPIRMELQRFFRLKVP